MAPNKEMSTVNDSISDLFVSTHDATVKQESRAVAGKPRYAVVIFQDGGRLPSWI